MVQIARAAESDVAQLVELLQSLFAIEQDFAADPGRQQRGLMCLLRQPHDRAALFVARSGGEVAGMASGQLVISTAEGAPSVWIEDVIVAERFRGQGIGRALLRSVIDWSAAQGATRAQLLADLDNAAAIAFYQRAGLDPTNLVALRLSRLAD